MDESKKMIIKNFEQITTHQLRQLNTLQFLDILKSDKIEAREQIIFTKLKEWVDGNEDERSKYVPECMKHIQLNRINGDVSHSRY